MSMNQKTIILVVVLFVLLIAGMFIYAGMKQQDLAESPTLVEEPTSPTSDEVPHPGITRITAKHFYIDGVHTIAGVLEMPTPCDLVETDVVVMESMPEQVRIDFNVINTAETCAQMITEARFQVSATASEEAQISARFMGRDIELNLIPAGPDETPEDFELFIKG
jgi:hypothetical protein